MCCLIWVRDFMEYNYMYTSMAIHLCWYINAQIYRDIQVKLENCKWLFQTENMDRFLIKWYFYYHKGGEFYMVPQKFRKNSLQVLKISVKARFPILKLPFSFNFIYCMLWFWQRFWEPRNIFFWIFMVPYKIPHLCNNKNTIWLKIYTCFLSEITIYDFPTCPGQYKEHLAYWYLGGSVLRSLYFNTSTYLLLDRNKIQ